MSAKKIAWEKWETEEVPPVEHTYRAGDDEDMMEALVSLGGDIADHICDRVEEPSIKCICGCQFAIY